MAYTFGDGFDCYAAVGDAFLGYWDSGAVSAWSIASGRFAGSRCLVATSLATAFAKSSGSNDAVHHIVCAYAQSAILSGTNLGLFFQFSDGATNQCCIVFRQDGAILLTSATPAGTVLDTWTGAVTASNTWFAFEFEVVIGASGSWAARKNGNTSNDHALGSLNTKPGTNAYANKLSVGVNSSVNSTSVDDLLWRSDAASVPWVGDIRAYTRMPASDVQAQFSKSSPTTNLTVSAQTTAGISNTTARYALVTPTLNGTVSSVTVTLTTGYTGNMKCALFSAAGAVIQSATAILSNPATGTNTFNFSPAVAFVKGATYYFGFMSDTSAGTWSVGGAGTGSTFVTTYAAFPSTAAATTAPGPVISSTLTATDNCSFVNEPQQDGTTSYVYDSNVGDADFYSIAALSGTPSSTVCVTTRGFVQKSDAGTRNAQVQLKSGGVTVGSGSVALSTSWGWLWRTDMTDPATSAAWTATGVNNVQIGPQVTA